MLKVALDLDNGVRQVAIHKKNNNEPFNAHFPYLCVLLHGLASEK